MIGTIIVCALIADFITGFFHWFEDSYITLKTPVLGPLVGQHNVEHHQHPSWIGSMSTLISRNLQTVAMASVATVVYFLFFQIFWPVVLILVFAAFGNEVHTWTHQPRSKRICLVKLLQDMCIVQTPTHHSKHHKEPYDRRYCTLTNWVNPVLDESRFWRFLEWMILKITGKQHARLHPSRNGF